VSQDQAKPPIGLDEVAQAILDLASRSDLAALTSRFLELLRGWAAPTAVLAAAEDASADSGWRLLSALCVGTGPMGTERVVARLVAETPEGRKRPTLVKPAEETLGVRVRDNWIVPWSHEGESGVLVVRGIASGSPSNLGDAVLAVASAVWPRLLGSPADRVQALIKDVEGAAARLHAETSRQLERLQQARLVPADERAELEARLSGAQDQAASAGRALEASKARAGELEAALRQAQQERDQKAGELAQASLRTEALASEQKASAARIEELQRAAGTAGAAEAKLRETEQHRDQARAEAERLAARVTEALREAMLAAERADLADRSAAADQQALQAFRQESGPKTAAFESAASALRRAAFVSEPLRTVLHGVVPASSAQAQPPWLSVVLLDRDTPPPLALADGLEAAGIRVRLAHEPEELALLISSPEASDLNVAICDIGSFGPDQNVAGMIRAWEKDKAGLEFYLSRSADPAEVERTRRVPLSLLAGHVQRPIQSAALVEALTILGRKLGKRP